MFFIISFHPFGFSVVQKLWPKKNPNCLLFLRDLLHYGLGLQLALGFVLCCRLLKEHNKKKRLFNKILTTAKKMILKHGTKPPASCCPFLFNLYRFFISMRKNPLFCSRGHKNKGSGRNLRFWTLPAIF